MNKICRKRTAENFVKVAYPPTAVESTVTSAKYEAWLKRRPKAEQVARALMDDDYEQWLIAYMAKRIGRYLKYAHTREAARARLKELRAGEDAWKAWK